MHLLQKRIGVCITAICLLLYLSVSVSAAVTWDLPMIWPETNFHVKNVQKFAAEVKNETGGEVIFKVHPSGSLGFKGPEMLSAIRDGLVPIGEYLLSQQVGEAPLMGLESQPYLAAGYDDLRILHKCWRKLVEDIAKKNNQKILIMVPWPRQYVFSKHQINEIADFKGLKIRIGNKAGVTIFNRLGASAVSLPWGEVVPSLATGTLDSVGTSTSSAVAGKFWEFMTHFYPTSHFWASNAVAVNLDYWNKLSSGQRDTIQNIANRLEPEFWEVSKKEEKEKAKILIEKGMILGKISPEMMAEMRSITAPIVKDYAKRYGKPAQQVLSCMEKGK